MILRTFSILVACVVAANSAVAFQQSGSGQAGNSTNAIGSESKALDLSGQTAKADRGTSITIPGIGSLGVLPKLDFGLELLYGEGPAATTDQDVEVPSNEDGLRIKGTLKHRF